MILTGGGPSGVCGRCEDWKEFGKRMGELVILGLGKGCLGSVSGGFERSWGG